MPQPIYPDANEVQIALQSTKRWPTDATGQAFAARQAALASASASAMWENVTGWNPFLSSGQIETRSFAGGDHNGDLDLEGGLLSLSSVSFDGAPSARDYTPYLWPQNALSRRRPYTHIRGGFWNRPSWAEWGQSQNRYTVSGVWGFALQIPDDVYMGLLQVAQRHVLLQLQHIPISASISLDGFSQSINTAGVLTPQQLSTLWGEGFAAIVAQYQRAVC